MDLIYPEHKHPHGVENTPPNEQCLECGQSYCGAHIGQHLKEVHCISLTLDHCREV
jgi:hypothetical protein